MRKLYITLILGTLCLPLNAIKELCACSASSPLYTHFVYMFSHASFLHWACNMWSLLVLHNLFRIPRLITAYLLAVAISFIPTSKPVLGLSVIVCFFMGYMAQHLWNKSHLGLCLTVASIWLSCILPGFAGIYHVFMFVFGCLYWQLLKLYCRIKDYGRDNER